MSYGSEITKESKTSRSITGKERLYSVSECGIDVHSVNRKCLSILVMGMVMVVQCGIVR